MFKRDLKKCRETRDQTANIHWIIEKAREFQKNVYLCFTDYARAFDCVDHNKLWKILQEMVISDHLTCLLRNLYAGQEATVRTGHGTTDWFQIGKGVRQEAGQVVWYSHLFQNFPQFIVIHTVKGFGIVKEAEVDVFLELSCFFNDSVDVSNLISCSSAFSKSSLNIWKFTVHILLKSGLENFEHSFASV